MTDSRFSYFEHNYDMIMNEKKLMCENVIEVIKLVTNP